MTPAQSADIAAACERVTLDYAKCADGAEFDALAALFAEDGVMELFGATHTGRAAIRESFAAGGGGNIITVHSNTNFRVDVINDSEAKSTAYVTVFVGDKTAPSTMIEPFLVGIYNDSFRKTADGWKFAKRSFTPLIAKAR
jgi:ketosteroid isomerase-like protein